jgi:hypothetical protein
VRHTANQPYNYESGSADNSYFPRDAAMQALLDEYQDVWRDYCVSDDPICAQGNYVNAHLTYFDNFTDSAAEWVKSKLNATTCDDCTYTVTAGSSVSGTSSAASSSGTGFSTSNATSATTTTTALPEATASTTENLSATPTLSASASASTTGTSGSTSNSDCVSLFGLAVAAGFAFFLV